MDTIKKISAYAAMTLLIAPIYFLVFNGGHPIWNFVGLAYGYAAVRYGPRILPKWILDTFFCRKS